MSSLQQRKSTRKDNVARTALDQVSAEVRADQGQEARAILATRSSPAREEPKGDLSEQSRHRAMMRDAFTVLGQRISRVTIMLTLITEGRARDSLSESESDELDWMLLDGVRLINEAFVDADGVIATAGVAA